MNVEWLIMGDYAQVVEGKLYLIGGGWSTLTINTGFPAKHMLGIAASVIVPWNETNQKSRLEIEVLTDDGGSLAKGGGEFTVGRPPTHPPGQDQRMQFAANVGVELKNPGTYSIVGRLEGQEDARTQFNVVPGPALAMKQKYSGKEPKSPEEPGGEAES